MPVVLGYVLLNSPKFGMYVAVHCDLRYHEVPCPNPRIVYDRHRKAERVEHFLCL